MKCILVLIAVFAIVVAFSQTAVAQQQEEALSEADLKFLKKLLDKAKNAGKKFINEQKDRLVQTGRDFVNRKVNEGLDRVFRRLDDETEADADAELFRDMVSRAKERMGRKADKKPAVELPEGVDREAVKAALKKRLSERFSPEQLEELLAKLKSRRGGRMGRRHGGRFGRMGRRTGEKKPAMSKEELSTLLDRVQKRMQEKRAELGLPEQSSKLTPEQRENLKGRVVGIVQSYLANKKQQEQPAAEAVEQPEADLSPRMDGEMPEVMPAVMPRRRSGRKFGGMRRRFGRKMGGMRRPRPQRGEVKIQPAEVQALIQKVKAKVQERRAQLGLPEQSSKLSNEQKDMLRGRVAELVKQYVQKRQEGMEPITADEAAEAMADAEFLKKALKKVKEAGKKFVDKHIQMGRDLINQQKDRLIQKGRDFVNRQVNAGIDRIVGRLEDENEQVMG